MSNFCPQPSGPLRRHMSRTSLKPPSSTLVGLAATHPYLRSVVVRQLVLWRWLVFMLRARHAFTTSGGTALRGQRNQAVTSWLLTQREAMEGPSCSTGFLYKAFCLTRVTVHLNMRVRSASVAAEFPGLGALNTDIGSCFVTPTQKVALCSLRAHTFVLDAALRLVRGDRMLLQLLSRMTSSHH